MNKSGHFIQHKLNIVDEPEQPAAKFHAQDPGFALHHLRPRLRKYD